MRDVIYEWSLSWFHLNLFLFNNATFSFLIPALPTGKRVKAIAMRDLTVRTTSTQDYKNHLNTGLVLYKKRQAFAIQNRAYTVVQILNNCVILVQILINIQNLDQSVWFSDDIASKTSDNWSGIQVINKKL